MDEGEELELSSGALQSTEELEYKEFTQQFADYAKKWGEPVPPHILLPLAVAECKASERNDADIPRLFRTIHRVSGVVDMTHGCLGKAGCQLLARYCEGEGAGVVTELRLDYNQMGDTGLQLLSEGLQSVPALHTISLEVNSIGSHGVSFLSKSLLSTSTGLQAVLLNNNCIRDVGVETVCKALCRSNTVLNSLHLQEVGLTARGCSAIRTLLEKCQTLRTLLLSRNPDIGDAGAAILAEGLAASTLKQCSLADIGITHRGAEAIAGAFRKPGCRLQEMVVGPNNFGDEGALYFANALEESQTVREVVMPRCGITVVGMKFLRSALLRNATHKVDVVHVEDNPGSTEEEVADLFGQCLRPGLLIHLSSNPKHSQRSKATLKGRSKHSPAQYAEALRKHEQEHARSHIEEVAAASATSVQSPEVIPPTPTPPFNMDTQSPALPADEVGNQHSAPPKTPTSSRPPKTPASRQSLLQKPPQREGDGCKCC